jgi:hypothetical protein
MKSFSLIIKRKIITIKMRMRGETEKEQEFSEITNLLQTHYEVIED